MILTKDIHTARSALLSWYDTEQRRLPWRAVKTAGQGSNPYHVWLSEIMLQQTTVQAVIPYFLKFIKKWPSITDLAQADIDDVLNDWAGLGYYARARNLHKCAKTIVSEWNGEFPQDYKSLKSLPGIGDYTAAAIMCIAFDKPQTVVDGNVERVISRLFALKTELPDVKPEIKEKAALFFDGFNKRPGDLAQGFMDLGATICTPKSPKCMFCPVCIFCKAKEQGLESNLPRKKPKMANPQKHGYVYWIKNRDGDVLIQKRPGKGMLAGMMGLPTSEWALQDQKIKDLEFFTPKNSKIKSTDFITHSFTHFDLKLYLISAELSDEAPPDHKWVKAAEIHEIGMPTLFKKALKQFTING